ncbi:hypothetical protein SECTIM467_105 [Brevibacillus phage SecTim467]|uniref:Uncharacterized protein n=2 Tax=Jenstvirus jenst TaxID=1982225 RepID=A0A0K2CPA8_9CAUD|nr:hypothetical protein AVV11_gp091 [Brevibacillus phage Jenst]ALA07229.1 hypothetical protein JENST_100 [Brevibacillus phage Jenst]ALA07445.1 hypothetical protein SECTIM467_105 [Brevibacillus phage SecTim467]
MKDTNGLIDIRQSATITQMQKEIMFLKGQNEAIFKMLSYITEQQGGKLVIPKDFGMKVVDSIFMFNRDENGDYVMTTDREETPAETPQLSQ